MTVNGMWQISILSFLTILNYASWFYRVSLINFLSKSNNIIIQHWNDAEFKKKYTTYQLQQIIVPLLLLHNVWKLNP